MAEPWCEKVVAALHSVSTIDPRKAACLYASLQDVTTQAREDESRCHEDRRDGDNKRALDSDLAINTTSQLNKKAASSEWQGWRGALKALLKERLAVSRGSQCKDDVDKYFGCVGCRDCFRPIEFGATFQNALAARKARKLHLIGTKRLRPTTVGINLPHKRHKELESSSIKNISEKQEATYWGKEDSQREKPVESIQSEGLEAALKLGQLSSKWSLNEEKTAKRILCDALSECTTEEVSRIAVALGIVVKGKYSNAHLSSDEVLGAVLIETTEIPASREENCIALLETVLLPRITSNNSKKPANTVSRGFSQVIKGLCDRRPAAVTQGLVKPLLKRAFDSQGQDLSTREVSILKEALSGAKRADQKVFLNLLDDLFAPFSNARLTEGHKNKIVLRAGALPVLQQIVNERPRLSRAACDGLLNLLRTFAASLSSCLSIDLKPGPKADKLQQSSALSALVHSVLAKLSFPEPARQLAAVSAILDYELPSRLNKISRKLVQAQLAKSRSLSNTM